MVWKNKIADPTPAEIRLRSEEVRQGWDEKTHRKRDVGKPIPWTPPLYKSNDLPFDVEQLNES